MFDIKISATHFSKGVGVVYMASRQEIKLFRPAVEHHLTLLLPFLPLMLDSISQRVYYLRRNLQRNWVVVGQVEVTNGLKFVYCVDQCWRKLILKVMHYNIALLPKKVTNYVTK